MFFLFVCFDSLIDSFTKVTLQIKLNFKSPHVQIVMKGYLSFVVCNVLYLFLFILGLVMALVRFGNPHKVLKKQDIFLSITMSPISLLFLFTFAID